MTDDKSEKVKVFYLPFGIETFRPVTRDLIEQKASCKFEFDRTSDKAKRLIQIINKVEYSFFKYWFGYGFVRLKIAGLFPHDIFVDRDGGVLRGNKGSLGLKPDTFIELKTLLEEWYEAKGCKF